METRELRYVIAVADELHFGRAARRLGIAQSPLSRAISQLERRLGIQLLQRDSRSVRLTPAGGVLLEEGRIALDAVDAAEQRTRRAAAETTAQPGIVLATKAGASNELLAKLLHAYSAEPGASRVDVTLCRPGEQAYLLRTGRADVAILHLPYDDATAFDTEELVTEGQVAVLPAGHPLTLRETLLLEDVDLAEFPPPRWPRSDGTYAAGPGPEIHSHAQLLQLISLGRTLMVAPDSCRSQLPEDLVAVPVVDAPNVTTVIAWPERGRSLAVAHLVRTALTM